MHGPKNPFEDRISLGADFSSQVSFLSVLEVDMVKHQ